MFKKTIVLGLDYSTFSGGVDECNRKMELLENEFKLANAQMETTGTTSQKLALKQEYLTEKINLQKNKVEEAKKKYNALMSEQADTKSIDKADKALLKERTTLQQLENQLEATRLADSGLKESMTATIAIVTGLAAGFLSCAKNAMEYVDTILTTADQTGISAETLQGWEYASELIDVSTETITSSIAKMVNNMATAEKGTGDAAEAFKKLGVKIKDSEGDMRDSEDVFYDVIDALGKMKNQTERDQLAMDLFGRSAQDLAGVINVGSEGLSGYCEEAEKLGLILSEEQLAKGSAASDAFEKFNSTLEALKNNLGTSALPILTALFETIAAIPQPVLSTIVVILSIVATIVTLVNTINSAVKAGSAITQVFSGISGAMDSTYVKILAITVAITALVVAIGVLIGRGKDLQNTMNSIGNMGSGGTSYTGSIGHNANGTQNWRGGATWVGENGPEIVNLPKGTQIYSNDESKRISGNKTYNINMNCDLSSMKSLNDVIDIITGIEESVGCGV